MNQQTLKPTHSQKPPQHKRERSRWPIWFAAISQRTDFWCVVFLYVCTLFFLLLFQNSVSFLRFLCWEPLVSIEVLLMYSIIAFLLSVQNVSATEEGSLASTGPWELMHNQSSACDNLIFLWEKEIPYWATALPSQANHADCLTWLRNPCSQNDLTIELIGSNT